MAIPAVPTRLLLLALATVASLSLPMSGAQSTNITSGTSLPAAAGAAWPSPSGHFAFGFYASGGGGLAVGVWLTSTPNVTVVWTAAAAGNDTAATTGGELRITNGGLVWTFSSDGRHQNRTLAVSPQTVVAAAAMRDDGSFVLYGGDGTVVWSTFDSPTDTLLPGQDLVPGGKLFSGDGKYGLTNQNSDGNLVMYPVAQMGNIAAAYWDTNTFTVGFPLTLRLNATGELYLTGGNYTKNLTEPGAARSAGEEQEVFYRVTLDPDGVLRLYRHAVVLSGSGGGGGAWTTGVRWIGPRDRCHVKGACGVNSYCELDGDAQAGCLCPPGFGFIDAGNAALGCTETSGAGDHCTMAGSGASATTTSTAMAVMPNMSWADTPYAVLGAATSAADCQAACVADCVCAAVLLDSTDGTCTKQQLPLMYGIHGGKYTLFVKNAAGTGTGTAVNPTPAGGRVGSAVTVAVLCVAVVLTCVSLAALLAAARLSWANRRTTAEPALYAMDDEEAASLRSFSYQELEQATWSFREPLGRGAFGTVFRGDIGGEKAVAVKRLEKVVEEGEVEFRREVRAIGRTSHRNLVRLLGFCHEGANRLLVYEYMSNGSLADRLFAKHNTGGDDLSPPTWRERMGIALDVARGLHYLHDDLDSRVIHCDVKPHNILMDAAGTAKIADFGLAKLLLPEQTRTFTGVRGTRGYMAPEWYRGVGPLTVKADVYSYGVVLLEIITCRRSMELEEAGEEKTLAECAHEWLVRSDIMRQVVVDCEDDVAVEVERAMKVAVWCAQTEPQARPAMRSIILMLEGLVEVPFPPPPTSS